MDKYELAFLRMTNNELTHFDTNMQLWQGTVLNEDVETIREANNSIDAAALVSTGTITRGITQTKNENLKKASAIVLKIINVMRGFAKKTGDHELHEAVNYSSTDLLQVSDLLTVNRCTNVLDKAEANMSRMDGYPVSNERIDEARELLASYNTLVASRSSKNTDRKMANMDIDELVDIIKDKFDILDDLVPGMIEDQDFVDKYFELRAIHEQGSRGQNNGNGGQNG